MKRSTHMPNENNSSNFSLEFIQLTEAAAIAAAKWIGKGDGKSADKAAVDAMRNRFNQIDFNGRIVIGEGAKDEAPELYVDERLGSGNGPLFDIAVDPLECTDSVAFGRPNAMAVIAVAPENMLYKAADSYMEKIAVGPMAANVINLDAPVADNIRNTAKALGKDISEITVAVLDRPRHEKLIEEIRKAGARVRLFTDGDVAMAVACSMINNPVDMLMGFGGSTEAVLAAAALRCIGGQIFARWKPMDFAKGILNEKHVKRLNDAGVTDFSKIFSVNELAKGDDIHFIATGVISGPMLEGVVFEPDKIICHSVIMSLDPRTIRFLKSNHLYVL